MLRSTGTRLGSALKALRDGRRPLGLPAWPDEKWADEAGGSAALCRFLARTAAKTQGLPGEACGGEVVQARPRGFLVSHESVVLVHWHQTEYRTYRNHLNAVGQKICI